MARSQKPAKFAKKPSHKAANALGYAKRQSRKTKESSSTSVTDVYEFQQEKVRRSKVKLQYERDELLGAGARGSESEDEDGGDVRRRNQPRLIGEGEENEQIDEDEDEDIDSDAAFDESDEERYAGFSFSHKVRWSLGSQCYHPFTPTNRSRRRRKTSHHRTHQVLPAQEVCASRRSI